MNHCLFLSWEVLFLHTTSLCGMGKFLFGIEGQIRARRRLRMHTQDILFCRSGHPPSLTSGEHAKNFNHLRANDIPHYHISANSHVLPHRTKISLVQKLEVSTLLSALITGRGRGSSCALLAGRCLKGSCSGRCGYQVC